jgi:hypothetical protein
LLRRELTTVVCRAFTHLHTHAVEVTLYLLETGSEDAEGVAAFEAGQEDDDPLASGAVDGVPAVFVVDLRGRLLGDNAVHGWVVEDAERDKAFEEEAEREWELQRLKRSRSAG